MRSFGSVLTRVGARLLIRLGLVIQIRTLLMIFLWPKQDRVLVRGTQTWAWLTLQCFVAKIQMILQVVMWGAALNVARVFRGETSRT